ncbi:13230_t:CDS:2, partial [Dentiscutata erythropus]
GQSVRFIFEMVNTGHYIVISVETILDGGQNSADVASEMALVCQLMQLLLGRVQEKHLQMYFRERHSDFSTLLGLKEKVDTLNKAPCWCACILQER